MRSRGLRFIASAHPTRTHGPGRRSRRGWSAASHQPNYNTQTKPLSPLLPLPPSSATRYERTIPPDFITIDCARHLILILDHPIAVCTDSPHPHWPRPWPSLDPRPRAPRPVARQGRARPRRPSLVPRRRPSCAVCPGSATTSSAARAGGAGPAKGPSAEWCKTTCDP